jgi:hypothetical protein
VLRVACYADEGDGFDGTEQDRTDNGGRLVFAEGDADKIDNAIHGYATLNSA